MVTLLGRADRNLKDRRGTYRFSIALQRQVNNMYLNISYYMFARLKRRKDRKIKREKRKKKRKREEEKGRERERENTRSKIFNFI